MARTFVVDSEEGQAKTPFLRGVMTSSLHRAGLPFDEAYALASRVRDQLSDRSEITTAELRQIVLPLIAPHGALTMQRYEHPAAVPATILVRHSTGQTSQFSRDRLRRVLESSGLAYEEANEITSAIFVHLTKRGVAEVKTRDLGMLTYRYLRLRLGEQAARRYLILVRLFRQELPIVVLIGGAPGTGKSALATELAQRLEVSRIQSSDLLREVMRMMIPERLMPVLHRSSYDAWRAIPRSANGADDEDAHLIDGYRAQAELLTVPCEAVIKRSLHERSSLILEGVHVNETLVEVVQEESGAIVIPILLAVLNKGRLRDRFRGRGEKVVGRRAERYLEHFDSIWRLQSYLLSQADRKHVPIIVNDNQERVVREVMASIVGSLSTRLAAEPKKVFV